MSKKNERIEVKIELACADKQSYDKLKELLAALPGVESLVEEPDDDKEPEAFQPKEGDICTCIIEDNVDAIFRYDGKTRTDEDGNVWLDGDLGLTWSGDLFHPYMVIHGEDAEYLRDSCRLATEEEIALYQSKVKEFEAVKKSDGKKWKVGEWVYVVGSEAGCSRVFYAVPVTYADTKPMENLVSRGWVFDKEADCEALCYKLNEAIKNVKL